MNKKELWITNISQKKDIRIPDLCLTIRKGQSINLLARDKKGRLRYNVTENDIYNSIKKGCISQKSNIIKVRKVGVKEIPIPKIGFSPVINRNLTRLVRKPTKIEELEYPDLDPIDEMESEEEFALENADAAFVDRTPILSVDPKFEKNE